MYLSSLLPFSTILRIEFTERKIQDNFDLLAKFKERWMIVNENARVTSVLGGSNLFTSLMYGPFHR